MNALPAAIESPSDHVGWIAAQIVAVPTSNELGIATDQELTSSSSEFIYSKFRQTNQDVYVYVRYLQTGQIERKSLVEQIRPVAAISIGAELSIRHELDSGAHAWGRDLQITKFQAYCGGRYIITTAVGSATMVFSTMPLGSSSGTILTDDHVPNPAVPELFWTLLGPSRVFRRAPQVGEKVQVRIYSSLCHLMFYILKLSI